MTFDKQTAESVSKSIMADDIFDKCSNRTCLDTTRLTEKQVSDINAITKKFEFDNKSLIFMLLDKQITKKQFIRKQYRIEIEYDRKKKEILAS